MLNFGRNEYHQTGRLRADLPGCPAQGDIDNSPFAVTAKEEHVCCDVLRNAQDHLSGIADF